MTVERIKCSRGDAPVIPFSDDGVPPAEFLIMPRPVFETTKGTFIVDDKAVASIMANVAERGVEFVIDYEHQTLASEDNGKPAPAAGWFTVEARDDGIYAVNCRWTETAAAYLRAREYRYHSPVFGYDPETMRVLSIETESLVNYPASLAQTPLAAKDTAPAEGVPPSFAIRKDIIAMAEDTIKDALEVAKAEGAKKDERIAALKSELATAKTAGEASEALIASVMEVAKCEKREELVGVCKAHADDAGKLAEANDKLAAVEAEKADAEKAALIEKCGRGEDTLKWLREQPLPVVKGFVEQCCKVPEVPATPQSADATQDNPGNPEGWFVAYCKDKGIRDEKKIAAEWKEHLDYKNANPYPTKSDFDAPDAE